MTFLTFDPSRFECVTDEKRLRAWLNTIKSAKSWCCDTETTGLDTITAEIVGIAMAVESGNEVRAGYVPIAHHKGKQIPKDVTLAAFRPLLEDPKQPKIFHNAAYDFNVFRRVGIRPRNIHDSMMMSYVLHGHTHLHGMDPLAKTYLNWKTIKFEDVVISRLGMKDFRDVSLPVATQYAAEDTAVTFVIAKIFQKLLKDRGQWSTYVNIDRHMPEVLADMKWNGVAVDFDQLAKLKEEWSAFLNTIEKRAHEQAGYAFGLNAPKDLAHLFFEHLNFEPVKYGKTGKPSLDKDTLKAYAKEEPVAQTILDHRKLAKYISTYCDGLAKFENATTHRIHGNLIAHRTKTGRFAASEPNLQNQPSRTDDTEFGKEGVKIRRAFIAPKGRVLVASDYSQIEYRLLGHITGAAEIIKAYHNNEDLHVKMASELDQVPMDRVPSESRKGAKNVNFATIYGAGYRKIAVMSGISEARALDILDFHAQWVPEVYTWKEKVISDAFDRGYSETIFGRRIFVPDIDSGDKGLRGGAERLAVNGVVQGSAADLMRLAMHKVGAWCRDAEVTVCQEFRSWNGNPQLLLSVHDELVVEVDEEFAEATRDKIKHLMETAADHLIDWTVPIVAEAKIGRTWYEAK